MSVLTFLKKAGIAIIDVASVVELGYPILGKFLPAKVAPVVSTAVSDLEALASVVTNVEAVAAAVPGTLTGAQKFAAALPPITKAIAQSSVLAGKKIKDQALFQKACNGYAQATVDLLNSVDPASVVTQPVTQ